MKTETPRTDAALCECGYVYISAADPHVKASFARELERELTEMKKQRDMLAEALRQCKNYLDGRTSVLPCSVIDNALAAVKGGKP